MKIKEIIIEGYKEASIEFAINADINLVQSTIEKYKQLVNKNQVTGNERNIDWWRKQGWDAFSKFVNEKYQLPTKTQYLKKQKQDVGNSIFMDENDEWLIVIPKDKNASCFHGKGTDWCTTKRDTNDFETYFYKNGITLIYFLNKKSGLKWAVATHIKKRNTVEYFDKDDKSITLSEFIDQTGINPEPYISKAHSDHLPTLRYNRKKYKDIISKVTKLLDMGISERNTEIENILLKTRDGESCVYYLKQLSDALVQQRMKHGLNFYFQNDIILETIELIAVKLDRSAIRFIPKPSIKVQLVAVKENGGAIEFIENPSEAVQLAAVERNGYAIEYIKNPSEAVQLAAVQRNWYGIRFIKNPSEAVQIAAVEQNGYAIRYIIENGIVPSEAVQLAAVEQNGYAIMYIKQNGIVPSEAVQIAAVEQNAYAIRYIKNPTPKVIELYKELTH